MLFAMCFDTSMLIGLLFFMLIAGLIACLVLVGLSVLVSMGVAKLIDAWRGPETMASLFHQNVP